MLGRRKISEKELLAAMREVPGAARLARRLLSFAENEEGLDKWRRRSAISIRARLRAQDNPATLFVLTKHGGFYTYWLDHWPAVYKKVRSVFARELSTLAGPGSTRHREIPLSEIAAALPAIQRLVRRTTRQLRAVTIKSGKTTALHGRKPLTRVGPWARPDPQCERAAVRHVTKCFKEDGYRVVSREAETCGYDLEATRGRRVLHLEVKGCKGDTGRFFISRNELKQAMKDSTWRLVVVTTALSHPKHDVPLRHGEMVKAYALQPTAWEGLPKRRVLTTR